DFCGGWCSRFDLVSITFTYDVSNTTYGERNGCCITWNKVCCGSRLYDRFTKVSDGNKFSTRISRWNDRSFLFGVTLSQFQKRRWAVVGEIIGTGVISSLFSVPFSKYVMGISHGAFFFMPSFMISSVAGALIGWVLLLKVQPAVLR